MNRIKLAIGVVWVGLMVGCGSSMEDPISNADGCRRLNEALAKVCTDDEAVQWLNCDVLPGCPSGTVEGQEVEICALQIEASTSCTVAKSLECTISKLDCGSAADSFTEPIGITAACATLLEALGTHCSDVQDSDCDQYVTCPGGAVESAEVLTCASNITQATSCGSARGLECAISAKYCAP